MRLSKLSKFRELIYAEGSAPSLNTLRARIDREEIPGGTVDGGRYYVDLDKYDQVTHFRDNLAAEQAELARSPLLQGLI